VTDYLPGDNAGWGALTAMNDNVIVWNLETVPDLSGFAAANQLVGKTDDEVREALGDKFPKHIYHSVVCIGAPLRVRSPSTRSVILPGPCDL